MILTRARRVILYVCASLSRRLEHCSPCEPWGALMLRKALPLRKAPISVAAPKSFQVVPRLLRIPEAAHYIGGTNWCVEELVRAKRIPFIVVGKYRVIDVRDLDAWIDAEKKAQLARAVATWPNETCVSLQPSSVVYVESHACACAAFCLGSCDQQIAAALW